MAQPPPPARNTPGRLEPLCFKDADLDPCHEYLISSKLIEPPLLIVYSGGCSYWFIFVYWVMYCKCTIHTDTAIPSNQAVQFIINGTKLFEQIPSPNTYHCFQDEGRDSNDFSKNQDISKDWECQDITLADISPLD